VPKCGSSLTNPSEWVLLNTKQELIKVVSVSQGTLNEALAHPREVFKPVIAFSAFAFIMVQ
jgi:DNA repair protein RadC